MLDPVKTQQEMQAELRYCGRVVNKSMITNIETLDLYKSLVINKSVDTFLDSVKTVLFPLYHPSQTNEISDEARGFNFCHGANFIADQSMDYNTITDVVILISKYVVFGGGDI